MSKESSGYANLPEDEEQLVLEGAGISEEDKKDVLSQIDSVVEKNRIPVTDELFEIKPRKKGSFFPILINILALFLIAGGVYYAYRMFNERQETLSLETSAYLSAEGKLIEEIRRESETKLKQKEEEISKIQQELQALDQQSQELKEGMEEEIQAREAELRRQLEAELQAERERLEEEGISEEEIEQQLEELEQARTREFEQQLEAFRAESEAALQEKEEELEQARELTEEILQRANRERRELERETEQRVTELREQFEEERAALETRTSEAQQRLRELSELREQEQLIQDQIVGAYSNIIQQIEANNFEAARSNIEKLKTLLSDTNLENLPTIAKRREIDQYLLSTLKESLETKTTEQPAETSSIVDAANLLLDARELVTRADTVRSQGQRATAKRLYKAALEEVPALNSAYNALAEINRREANEAVESRISTGNALIENGNVDEAVEQYRSALNEGTAADEALADRAVGNIIQVLSQREQRNIAEKNSDITALEQRISELIRENQEREGTIAELNSTIDERNRTITELRTAIDRREGEIAGLEETVNRKNGEIDRLEEQIASREKRIESLSESLEDKTSEAERLSETLEGKEGETGSLSAAIEEKNERISELGEDIQELNIRLEEVQTELRASRRGLSRRNETINSLQSELEQKEAEIASLQDEVRSEEETVDALQSRIEELNRQLELPKEFATREELAEARENGRESAFTDVSLYVQYVAEGEGAAESERDEMFDKIKSDVLFRNTVENIEELLKSEGVEPAAGIVKAEEKLLGTVSSVAGSTVVVEPLVTISVDEGSTVLIKRKTSSRTETTIAEGTISSISAGRITAKVQRVGGSAARPSVMDLVYLEIYSE